MGKIITSTPNPCLLLILFMCTLFCASTWNAWNDIGFAYKFEVRKNAQIKLVSL